MSEFDHLNADLLFMDIHGGESLEQIIADCQRTLRFNRNAELLNKALDSDELPSGASQSVLAKSRPLISSKIPAPFFAQCCLCNKNFRSRAELDRHDHANAALHKRLLATL